MEKFLNLLKRLIPNTIFKAAQPTYHFLLSWFAALFFGFPSEKMIIIGVTGTTGKTTSIYLVAKILKEFGFKVGFTSTAMFSDGEREWMNDKKMTMPGRFFTQRMLKKMLKNKCQFAIIETTSEGIRQFRHRFINYDHLIFTGLYPEHIESHGSFENYKQAKGKLFAHLKNCKIKYANDDLFIYRLVEGIKKIDLKRIKKTVIANLDDEHAPYFLSFWAEEKIGYTQKEKINQNELPENLNILNYNNIEKTAKGTSFKTLGQEMELNILGEFNVTNVMNAVALASLYKIEPERLKKAFLELTPAPGRLEVINEGQDFKIIVDYAFEPIALGKLYEVVEGVDHNKIIHVLGSCGGGRDESRRPKLGKLAGEKADIVIVTNEDPYDEDPELIIAQVAVGAENAGKKVDANLFKILDRREAIKKALSFAGEGDIVIITGKGNEQAICTVHGGKIPWDDRKVVREEIKNI